MATPPSSEPTQPVPQADHSPVSQADAFNRNQYNRNLEPSGGSSNFDLVGEEEVKPQRFGEWDFLSHNGAVYALCPGLRGALVQPDRVGLQLHQLAQPALGDRNRPACCAPSFGSLCPKGLSGRFEKGAHRPVDGGRCAALSSSDGAWCAPDRQVQMVVLTNIAAPGSPCRRSRCFVWRRGHRGRSGSRASRPVLHETGS